MSNGDLGTSNFEKDGYSVKGKEKGKGAYAEVARVKTGDSKDSGDSLWVHVGDRDLLSREDQLNHCLVGCFGDSFEYVPPLSSLKEWAFERWFLKGGLKISRLGGALVLSDEQVECGKRHRAVAGARGKLASAAERDSTVSGPRPRTAGWEAYKEAIWAYVVEWNGPKAQFPLVQWRRA